MAEFGRTSFVSKKTVASVPLLGQVMTAVCLRDGMYVSGVWGKSVSFTFVFVYM